MADGIHPGILAAIGASVLAAGRVLFGALLSAKDKQIAVQEAEIKRLHGERDRLGDKIDRLREEAAETIKKKDAEILKLCLQVAAVAYRSRQEHALPSGFEEEMPTGVRNMIDVVSSRSPGQLSSVDRLLAKADERDPSQWSSETTPPEPMRPRAPSRPR